MCSEGSVGYQIVGDALDEVFLFPINAIND